MTDYRVGMDVGGTKAAVLAEPLDGGETIDVVIPSTEWDAEPADAAAQWLHQVLRRALPSDARAVSLAIGAQGFDNAAVIDDVVRGLARLGYERAACVNDAALLLPAAGLTTGIALIAGTGAIGIGADADGRPLSSGGWGWVLGDDAGGAGLVREATRSALAAHDDGREDDGLLGALLEAFGVSDAERLARAVNDEPTMANWAPKAPAVFAAAEAGSERARGVIAAGADHLALLAEQLVRRGATGTDIVAAGSVIVHQPRLADGLRDRLAVRLPGYRFSVLTVPPVHGALALAR